MSAEPGSIRVEVACSPSEGQVVSRQVDLPQGATLLDAIHRSGLAEQVSFDPTQPPKVGVWGQLRPLDYALREGDRVEIYRPLLIDPKDARRLRQRGQTRGKR